MSTPTFAHVDTKRPDGFYVQFSRQIIEDDGSYSWADIDVTESRLEAFKQGDWYFIGVRAIAKCLIVINGFGTLMNLESPSLYWIESDSDASYLDEVYGEEIENLKAIIDAMRSHALVYESQ